MNLNCGIGRVCRLLQQQEQAHHPNFLRNGTKGRTAASTRRNSRASTRRNSDAGRNLGIQIYKIMLPCKKKKNAPGDHK